MRILHTSDWHLGKFINSINLLEDQKNFLEQLMTQVQKAKDENNPYTAVLVAGDIYDRQTPPEEATQVLSSFLNEFNERFPEVHLFMISGNHDSAARLSFASEFFHKHNIHLTTNTKKITEPIILTSLNSENEKAAIYQLPYLFPNSLKNPKDENVYLKHQQELYDEACRLITEAHNKNYKDMPAVLVAHPFAMGLLEFGSERSNVGQAEQVDIATFKDFTYCAFGHIHGYHVCDSQHRCFYSGAPLAYHADDNPETFMLDVELKGKEVPSVKKIKITPVHPLVKLEGKIDDFTENKEKWSQYKNSYVCISLTDEIAVEQAATKLKEVFPFLVSAKPKSRTKNKNSVSLAERKKAIDSKNVEKIFTQFVEDIEQNKISDMSEEQQELFKEEVKLMEEIAKEINWGNNN